MAYITFEDRPHIWHHNPFGLFKFIGPEAFGPNAVTDVNASKFYVRAFAVRIYCPFVGM